MAKHIKTYGGKIYPFNEGVFKKLDSEDKVNYKLSHANKSKKIKKDF
jgi:hypothetical protein